MSRDDLPDLTPERCTHVDTVRSANCAFPRLSRCIHDADPAFTYNNGRTCLCRDHGEARERAEEVERDVPSTTPDSTTGGGLDLAHRLADGDMTLMLAILDYQHALIMASHAHADWSRYTAVDWWANRWRDAIMQLAHAAHELERQLDARDARRQEHWATLLPEEWRRLYV